MKKIIIIFLLFSQAYTQEYRFWTYSGEVKVGFNTFQYHENYALTYGNTLVDFDSSWWNPNVAIWASDGVNATSVRSIYSSGSYYSNLNRVQTATPYDDFYALINPVIAPLLDGEPATQEEIDFYELEDGETYTTIPANFADHFYFNQHPMAIVLEFLIYGPNGIINDGEPVYSETVNPGDTINLPDFGLIPSGYSVETVERPLMGVYDPEINIRWFPSPAAPTVGPTFDNTAPPSDSPPTGGETQTHTNTPGAYENHVRASSPASQTSATPAALAERAATAHDIGAGVESALRSVLGETTGSNEFPQMNDAHDFNTEPVIDIPEFDSILGNQTELGSTYDSALDTAQDISDSLVSSITQAFAVFEDAFASFESTPDTHWEYLPAGTFFDNPAGSLDLGSFPFDIIGQFLRAVASIFWASWAMVTGGKIIIWSMT